ncbi:2304_t:CDS:1, partial [Cetraspora pellucida]
MEEYQHKLTKLIIAINNYKINDDTKSYYKKNKEKFKFFFDYTDKTTNNNNELIIMLNSEINKNNNTNDIDKNDYNLNSFSKDISNLSCTGSVIEIIAKKTLNMFVTNFANNNSNYELNDMIVKSRRLTIIIKHEESIHINEFAKMNKIITFFKYDKQVIKERKYTRKSNDEKEYNTIINSMSKLKIDNHEIIGLKTTKLLESKFIDIIKIINDYNKNKHELIANVEKFYNFTLGEL